jgi:glutathione-regulated potassium-efflux system protein KefB
VPANEAADIAADVRRRDAERFELEMTGGIYAGADLLLGNAPKPRPFTTPKQEGRALSDETAAVTGAARAS